MDWLGYSPADLVPFSGETWLALLARYNEDHLPAVIAGMALGLVLLRLTAGRSPRPLRPVLALLGLCWLWISWTFLHQALGTLLWAADWLAWAFAVQGALLLLCAGLPYTGAMTPRPRLGSPLRYPPPAWWLLATAVLLWPVLELAVGRVWTALGWFGTGPDATAAGTLAVAAMTPGRRAWLLLPVPVLWCLVSSAMLGVFEAPLWWLPLVAPLLVGPLSWLERRGAQDPVRLPPSA